MKLDSIGGRYAGISTQTKKNDTLAFYITYRNYDNMPKRIKVGESPEMTKTKALNILNEKKAEVRNIKNTFEEGSEVPVSIIKKPAEKVIYTLNSFADFYFKSHGSELKNLKASMSRYEYHWRDEAIANKPVQLITKDDLVEFLNAKKEQRSDKRRNVKEGNTKTLVEMETEEFYSNIDQIENLEEAAQAQENWRERNKIKFLKKKNDMLAYRIFPDKAEALLKDKSIGIDDKNSLLGILSRKSLKEIFLQAIAIVNYAIEVKDLQIRNPFVLPKRDPRLKIKVENVRDRFLNITEIKEYLREVKLVSENPKHKNIYLMAMFALSIAARQSTILSIKVEDITLENNEIKLRNHKTEKWYSGIVASPVIKEEIIKLSEGKDPTEYLFTNYTGKKPYRYPRILGEILNYTVNYNKSYTNWLDLKDFRNTVASQLAMAEVPLTYIKDVLNHSTIRMTERYAHLAPNSGSESIKKLVGNYTDQEEDQS